MNDKINKNVKKCVDSKDKIGLIYIFVDCLDADPTFDESKDDYEYCKKNAKWLFGEYKELTPLSQNVSDWDEEYWIKLKCDLENNFCDKRFQHMIKVAQVVYKDKIERLKKERLNKIEIEEKKRALEEENRRIEQQQYQQIRYQKPTISASERQRIEIEEKKRALEEENRRIEQQEQQEQSYTEKKYQQSNGDSSKKAFGVVLLVIIVMAVVAIIKLVLL